MSATISMIPKTDWDDLRLWLVQTPACYAKKTIAFKLEFSPEIVENARYERLTLFSLEDIIHADRALGQIN